MAAMQRLEGNELDKALRQTPGWALRDGKLAREWMFSDFVAAIAFVNRVAEIAEAAGHHPDIDIRYNRVSLGLVTHDAGGITPKDVEMAQRLSAEV
jgi:4a-hydroxytetrahydrobiopterin dehydratase